jgi:hypothetical protein
MARTFGDTLRRGDGNPRYLVVVALLLLQGCSTLLRAKGSDPQESRPAFEEIQPELEQFKVWVLVPELTVHTYPQSDGTQQPMLQFTGDQVRLDQGWGALAMLVAPDRFHDDEAVTVFADQVLWTERLRAHDERRFALWLRENNRSAPTRFDRKLEQVDRIAEAVEEISELSGFKIPARRAINVSAQAFKELQQDWLILHWSCPWQHVLQAARQKLAQGNKETVILRTRLVSAERVKGRPVAEVTVVFVVKVLRRALPASLEK